MLPKILIIENEIELLELTRSYFEKAGFSILSSPSGEEGLKTARNKQPHLIILDLILEDANGFEICNEIKTSLLTKHIPVLMTTGQIMTEEMKKEFRDLIPPDAILTKPFEIEELMKKVKELLKSPSS